MTDTHEQKESKAIITMQKKLTTQTEQIAGLKKLLKDWETWEAGLIIDGTEKCIEVMKSSNMDKMVKLQQRRNAAIPTAKPESEDNRIPDHEINQPSDDDGCGR